MLQQAIESLRQALPDTQLSERGSEQHKQLNSTYLSELESDIEPAWILQPRNKDEVSSFLKAIKPFIDHVKFAVRGAGCQPTPGCANIEGGITVDLSLLTGINVKDGHVQIAAGERWGAVYKEVVAHGLGVSGSRSSKGGIGGLSLAGKNVCRVLSVFLLTPQVACRSSPVERGSSVTPCSTTRLFWLRVRL
jgi:hypothetical protein